jgi:hypothetical protein
MLLASVTAMAAAMTPHRAGAVFPASVVAGVAYVAPPVARLICVEVIEVPFAARRQRSGVTVTRIVAVIDVAVEAMRTVKPGTCSYEETAVEPIRSVIAVWRAVIGRKFVVPVRASRFRSDVNGDLRGRHMGRTE